MGIVYSVFGANLELKFLHRPPPPLLKQIHQSKGVSWFVFLKRFLAAKKWSCEHEPLTCLGEKAASAKKERSCKSILLNDL